MNQAFTGYKRISETIDFYIDCSEEFALTDPIDQINSASWAVESGDVTIDSSRIEDTDKAVVRVSGGTKLYSWHRIRATITCDSGQVYTPMIRIQLTR